MKADWTKGRLLENNEKNSVCQEFICLGCPERCRIVWPLDEPDPDDCQNPGVLERNQEIKDDIESIFKSYY